MIKIFKEGDVVIGIKSCQYRYTYTSHKNGGYGIVKKVYPSRKEMRVKWVGGMYPTCIEHTVDMQYFELKETIKLKGNDYVA